MDDYNSRPRAFGNVIDKNCTVEILANKQSIVKDKMLPTKMTKKILKITNKNIKNTKCKIFNKKMKINGVKGSLPKSRKKNLINNSKSLGTTKTTIKKPETNVIKNEQSTEESKSNQMIKLLTTPELSENFNNDTIYEYYYLKMKTTSEQLDEMNRKNDNLSKEIQRLRNENKQLELLTQEFEELYGSLFENLQKSD